MIKIPDNMIKIGDPIFPSTYYINPLGIYIANHKYKITMAHHMFLMMSKSSGLVTTSTEVQDTQFLLNAEMVDITCGHPNCSLPLPFHFPHLVIEIQNIEITQTTKEIRDMIDTYINSLEVQSIIQNTEIQGILAIFSEDMTLNTVESMTENPQFILN